MKHRFGFFDVDSRELGEAGCGLSYRPRVQPIVPKLERLYALADERSYPLVFTTCCSGRMPLPENLRDTLYVPLDDTDTSWRNSLAGSRRIYLAKRTCGSPKLNLESRTFDMFHHNGNASRLVRELDVETWVVFGNGFDYCVGSAARGILDARLPLIVLDDVRVASAGATPQSEEQTARSLRERGARLMTLALFLDLAKSP